MMNNVVKDATHPSPEKAIKLKPLELNNIRIGRKHTVLTPEQLEETISQNNSSQEAN